MRRIISLISDLGSSMIKIALLLQKRFGAGETCGLLLSLRKSRKASRQRRSRVVWLLVCSLTHMGTLRDVSAPIPSLFPMLTTNDVDDVCTILGGLMSGGFETVLATAIAGIAYLASPEGQNTQATAYKDIIDGYGSVEAAFQQAVTDEKSPYVVAFVRETLRYYPPLHILPPRQTYRDFEWNGVKIPKGVMVLANAQAINHGTSP